MTSHTQEMSDKHARPKKNVSVVSVCCKKKHSARKHKLVTSKCEYYTIGVNLFKFLQNDRTDRNDRNNRKRGMQHHINASVHNCAKKEKCEKIKTLKD